MLYTSNYGPHLELHKNPIKIPQFLVICKINCFVLPVYAELMGICQYTREGEKSHILNYFPIQYLILTHYIISAWRMRFLEGLGHYKILLGKVKKVMAMTTSTMDIVYTYDRHRLNNPPEFFVIINHLLWLSK